MDAGVTYAEVRTWAVWLNTFTASMLADAMGVDLELGKRGVTALTWHGICEGTGDMMDGPDGPEEIISYVPLPPGPTHHPHEPPPEVVAYWEMGGDPLRQPRGYPVAMGRTNGKQSRLGVRSPGRRGPSPQVQAERRRAKGRSS